MAADRDRQEAHAHRFADGRTLRLRGALVIVEGPEGNSISSCAIITTTANDLLRPIHDRMPVILPKNMEDFWLDGSLDDPVPLGGVLIPYPHDAMEAYEVSTLVNSFANDSPEVIAPMG